MSTSTPSWRTARFTVTGLRVQPEMIGGISDAIQAYEPWMRHARCTEVDPDIFHPERGESNHAAKQICRHCPVRTDCLQHAVKHHEPFGIWGGLSPKERRAAGTTP